MIRRTHLLNTGDAFNGKLQYYCVIESILNL
jgi:hypothetical protein